ncbi:MAG: bifunctional phosphoglucose/phosphomannose isomerase [Chloroflexi bacterium]|nr:bifunctional phosphoglucose/phosphomannose isomerase [Chloroflexota bacterium]
MLDLDEPQTYLNLDPSHMRERILELPRQCQNAWQRALALPLPPEYSQIRQVLVLGMGGSAIGGDLLASLALPEGKVPIFIHRNYDLPPFVGEQTLVIASSYSGNTEETLSAFRQALTTRAKTLAITGGGQLLALAEETGTPVFPIDYKAEPRAVLGYSFIPLLAIGQRLCLFPEKSPAVAEAVAALDELVKTLGPTIPLAANPAKNLATKLHGRLVVIYGGGFLTAVANRWKTQINENSKAWAFYELFPELNHNAVVGYQFPATLSKETFVVLLRSPNLHPRIILRYQATLDILTQRGIDHQVVDGMGTTPLSQMLSLVFWGDLVSYYLALLYQTDPTPVSVIQELKARLANA